MQTVIYMCYCKFLILNARNLYLREIVTSTSHRLKFKTLLSFFEIGELEEIGLKALYLQFYIDSYILIENSGIQTFSTCIK